MRIKGKALKIKPVEPNEAAGSDEMRIIIIEHCGLLTGLLVDSVDEGVRTIYDKVKRLPDEATTAISRVCVRECVRECVSGVALLDKSNTPAICALAGMAGPEGERALAGGA